MKNEYYEGVRIKNSTKQKFKTRERKESVFNEVEFKKSLGQNFISDKNLLNSIANIANVGEEDYVLEIGAGAGTLTTVLASRAKRVISYEIDNSLQPILNNVSKKFNNLEIRFQDFIQADVSNLFDNKYKVVANIPYYITTPIIFKLLEEKERIGEMLFMVQKEVAERFASKAGTKLYGITSVILQSIADVSYEKTVKKECFTPHPKVDSALVKIKFNEKYKIDNFEEFKKFIHSAFAMRRKTLINNLTSKYNIDKEQLVHVLTSLNFSLTIRPEDLSVENFVNLFNKLIKNKK